MLFKNDKYALKTNVGLTLKNKTKKMKKDNIHVTVELVFQLKTTKLYFLLLQITLFKTFFLGEIKKNNVRLHIVIEYRALAQMLLKRVSGTVKG